MRIEIRIEESKFFESLPKIMAVSLGGETDESYIFISPRTDTKNYIMILNSMLIPVFIKEFDKTIYDFKVQQNGNITYFDSNVGAFIELNNHYEIINEYTISNDYSTDFHDFILTEDNHSILMGSEYKLIRMDTIVEDGKENATVKGLIIQEYDESKNLIFQWDSWDHYKITDSKIDLTSQVVDYVHGNSIEIDKDGDLIISACYFDEITKIDRLTGDIIWRLGGKNNEFNFTTDTMKFSKQHSARINKNGNLTIFDNAGGVGYDNKRFSRGLEYQLNDITKEAELLNAYVHPDSIYSLIMGNMQNLSNGNKLIGWGTNLESDIFMTEFDSTGKIIYDLHSADIKSLYRVFKFDWESDILTFNVDSLNYDTVEYGSFNEKTISVHNNSDQSIELTGYNTLLNCYTIQESFPTIVGPNDSVELTIKFEPDQFGGYFNDFLQIYSDQIASDGNRQRIGMLLKLKAYSNDIVSPEFDIKPLNNQTKVDVNTFIEITSNEPIRYVNDEEITEDNIDGLFELWEVSPNYQLIDNASSIDYNKKIITLTPNKPLNYSAEYCLELIEDVEDTSNNSISDFNSCFSTEAYTGIELNRSSDCTIHISPNPSKGKIIIDSSIPLKQIEINTLLGERVYINKIVNNKKTLNIDYTDKDPGLYILKVVLQNNDVKIVKILKN